MMNLQSIFKQIITELDKIDFLKSKIDIEVIQKDLIKEMDNIFENILINIADNYPQAPAAGGTPRMR